MGRPARKDRVPPPLYLSSAEHVPYCLTCGRIISSRKAHNRTADRIKYCSDRCRRCKPGKLEQEVEKLICSLLQGEGEKLRGAVATTPPPHSFEPKNVVNCTKIEEIFFQRTAIKDEPDPEIKKDSSTDPEPHYQLNERIQAIGRERNDTAPECVDRDTIVASPLPDELIRARQGQRRAEEREFIRRAARRAVVFGIPIDKIGSPGKELGAGELPNPHMRKCEAVQDGRVVEPSFAKGEWAIRWRD